MATSSKIAFATVLLALGFGLGWGLKPERERVVEVRPAKSEAMANSRGATRRTGGVSSALVKRLNEGEGDAKTRAERLGKELGDEDLQALIEAVMSGAWGGMGFDEVESLRALVGEWMSRDMEGCLAWARGQEDRKWKEAALLAIVDQLGESNPVMGLNIYCEIDRITLEPLSNVNGEHWEGALSKIAREEGPQGVAEILNKLPLSPTLDDGGFEQWLMMDFNAPEGFDFDELMRLSPEIGFFRDESHHLVVDVLQNWARQDFDGAWEHVTARMANGDPMAWGTLLQEYERSDGAEAATRLAYETIQDLPPQMLGAFLESSWRWEQLLELVPDQQQQIDWLSRMNRWDSERGPFGEDRWTGFAEHVGMDPTAFVQTIESLRAQREQGN